MAFEIERKFLVRDESWRKGVQRSTRIRQAYLSNDGKASIRVRIKDGSRAILTIKSRGSSLRRLEFEHEIPLLEAEALIGLRHGAVLEKVRHEVPAGCLTWEIDEFLGENEGLVLAEVELRSEDQTVDLPEWIGVEVTRQAQYYNSALSLLPFSAWSTARSSAATSVA
ncbi:MAG: CYTH domain-containing protein [Hyphomicrobiaceae bacterium]